MPNETDEIGAPPLPRLCDDHKPVVGNLAHLDHVGDSDSTRVATELARQCPNCRSLT